MLDKTTHNSLVKTRICLDLAFFSQKSGIKIVFLESCTGGLVSSWITTLNGSSSWFEGGIVAYSNQMKILFLDVHKEDIQSYGVVSEQIASTMANSFTNKSFVNVVTCSITGIAGPGGGSKKKPVGLVCFGFSGPWGVYAESKIFNGNRRQVREQASIYAIILLAKKIALSKYF